jgi:hypothetical protein
MVFLFVMLVSSIVTEIAILLIDQILDRLVRYLIRSYDKMPTDVTHRQTQ